MGALQVSEAAGHQVLDNQVARREERSPTNWIATVRLRDGTEIPCNVKDVSKSGAKIGVPASQPLPDVFMLRIIGRDFLCLVRLAWRRGDYVGVRIERIGKVSAPTVQVTEAAQADREAQGVRIGVRSRKGTLSAF